MEYKIPGPVLSITSDSRQVQQNSLFLAYPGQHSDGRKFIVDAIQRGATTVLWEREGFEWNPQWTVHQQPITNLAHQAGHIASQFYQNPSEHMWCIGVTGTNGKTTVTHWLTQAYSFLQRKAAVIGTLGNGVPEALQATQNTTPGPIELQRVLAEFVRDGVQVVAMEVSSHGLDQGRVNGVAFDVAVFTNLSRDHLDYHQTMEAYQAAKRKLFEWKTLAAVVINEDDPFGASLVHSLRNGSLNVLTYGLLRGDIRATRITMHDTGFEVEVQTPMGAGVMQVHALGQFNVYNALAVLGSLLASNVALAPALQAVSGLVPVPGRMQMFGGGDLPLVVVDYAHTPDALEKALHTLRLQHTGQLSCVFGCGGDRDTGKRAEMGRIASELADSVIITNDNPRYEDPAAIIAAITQGMQGKYSVEPDREKAIAIAINSAGKGDVVLVAGKGHETYQDIAGTRHAFSDAHCVQTALRKGKVNA